MQIQTDPLPKNYYSDYIIIIGKDAFSLLSVFLTVPLFFAQQIWDIKEITWQILISIPLAGLFLALLRVGYKHYKLNQKPEISFQPAERNHLIVVSNKDVYRGLQLCDAIVSNNNRDISVVITDGSLFLKDENVTAKLKTWLIRETGASQTNLLLAPGESKQVSPLFSITPEEYEKFRNSSERLLDYELTLKIGVQIILIKQQITLIPK